MKQCTASVGRVQLKLALWLRLMTPFGLNIARFLSSSLSQCRGLVTKWTEDRTSAKSNPLSFVSFVSVLCSSYCATTPLAHIIVIIIIIIIIIILITIIVIGACWQYRMLASKQTPKSKQNFQVSSAEDIWSWTEVLGAISHNYYQIVRDYQVFLSAFTGRWTSQCSCPVSPMCLWSSVDPNLGHTMP